MYHTHITGVSGASHSWLNEYDGLSANIQGSLKVNRLKVEEKNLQIKKSV